MKKIINLLFSQKRINPQDFLKNSILCPECNQDMFLQNEKTFLCSNDNCQKTFSI